MNHETIEQNQVIERYRMGRLSPAEQAEFEEHYLDCEACLRELEVDEAFQVGLKTVAAEDVAAHGSAEAPVSIASRRPPAASRRWGLLAAAALVAVLLPVTYLQRRVGQAERRTAALADELAATRAPQQNTPIVSLSPERSGLGGGQAPSVRVRLPATSSWLVVALELDQIEAASYRAVLRDGRGMVLWQGDGLVPNYQDALVVSLHSSQLTAGDHEAAVEAVSEEGEATPVARFRFRVDPAP